MRLTKCQDHTKPAATTNDENLGSLSLSLSPCHVVVVVVVVVVKQLVCRFAHLASNFSFSFSTPPSRLDNWPPASIECD
ncbi:MAG: hypothetical protein N6V41_01060, partial [Candidatus Portiera aleyrodidarum]|nr:hypothetical protein [Candidatus Portiera aleyrodidarum]